MKFVQESPMKYPIITLEAKQLVLNEQLDRLANKVLSEEIFVKADTLFSANDYDVSLPLSTISETDESTKSFSETRPTTTKPKITANKGILRKYFDKWKKCTATSLNQKLDTFIENLKNHEAQKSLPSTPTTTPKLAKRKYSECFKNRYKTQKNIIDSQKSQIDDQNKIINELKLGIIREDLLKSMENTKFEIREIFSSCSERILSQAPLLVGVDERDKIMVQSQKAPKIVQKMHERAVQRAKSREIILERKRIIEEARQRLLEEAIDKKRVLEEEERKRNLDLINEQRKRELQLQKQRNERRQAFDKQWNKSVNFYNKLLLRQCFQKLLNNYNKYLDNLHLGKTFYELKLKKIVFTQWVGIVDAKYTVKYRVADSHYSFKVLTWSFSMLKENKLDSKRSMQVAEDLYDFRLLSNAFIQWHIFVCKQIMLETKKEAIAIKHNKRRMLFQYFYQWRSLPVVIQLEKAKEEKKRKWREKVWEILPDYQPPSDI